MSNHLKDQSSPYLLQHAGNPVDWYPWGTEAFEKAQREDKPVFLSIGYSTCHWCHVMAHESFENEQIAEILNRYFVSIKVDREERPDIDSVYMSVCQSLSGSGGWPMSIFMTAAQKPFFAGTYYPPESRPGMIGFTDLLLAIAEKWKSDRETLTAAADTIVDQISTSKNDTYDIYEEIREKLPAQAVKMLCGSFDAQYGGFGPAPKFPLPHNLLFLMLYAYLAEKDTGRAAGQVKMTLMQMRRGGIFDQIGHGFSRYSTDRYYLVPHFEKMLYDNALLIITYAAAYRFFDEDVFLDTAKKTADYVLCEMTGENGEFYSAQDADSDGEEGKFYTWSYEEVCAVLGKKKGKQFCEYYHITKQGRKILYQHRRSRMKLHLDDKTLTSWNALMINALALLYRVSGKREYLLAAQKAEQFLKEYLTQDAVLYVGCRRGRRLVKGFLDDDENGGYFLYGTKNDGLIARPKETYDGALPSGNSVMAYVLVRLLQYGQTAYETAVRKQFAFLAGEAKHYPAGHTMAALLWESYPPQKITVVLTESDNAEQITARLPLYADITVLTQETEEYPLLHGRTTYYICKNHTCLPPVNQAPFCHRDIT